MIINKYFFQKTSFLGQILLIAIVMLSCDNDKNNVSNYENYINKKEIGRLNSSEKKCIELVLSAQSEAKKHEKENTFSSSKFEEAVQLSKANQLNTLEIWSKLNYCKYLYQYRDMPKSLPVMISLIHLLEKKSPSEIINPSNTYQFVGYYLETIGQHQQSIYFLKKAIATGNKSTDIAAINDNIGIAYTKLNKIDSAKYFFNKSLVLAKKNKNTLREGKVYGNLAQLHIDKNEYENAISLLEKDIMLSKENKADQNTMFAMILLGKSYLKNNSIIEAKKTLENALEIAKTKDYFQSSELEILKQLKIVYRLENNESLEVSTDRKIDDLENVLEITDGPKTIADSQYKIEIANINLEYEKEKLKLSDTRLKNRLLIATLVVFAIITILVQRNISKKLKNEKAEHQNLLLKAELERVNSEMKLNDAHHSLSSYYRYLSEKNTQIERLNNKIKSLEKSNSVQKTQNLEDLHTLLESHLMTDENWFRFKKTFILHYPEYYDFLVKNYDELTESNLRLIMLLKLGINSKEIPNILGISSEAIKKAKQRLRKKLGDRYDLLFLQYSVTSN
jgi:Tfp pilus assembly protein PilF